MERLKGGKLLLDLSYTDVFAGGGVSPLTLSDEEIDCILTKGLAIKSQYSGVIVVLDILFDNFVFEDDVMTKLTKTLKINGVDYDEIILSLSSKTLEISEI